MDAIYVVYRTPGHNFHTSSKIHQFDSDSDPSLVSTAYLDSNRTMSKLIRRIGVDDPRMAKIVIHSGVVYLSGLTDTTAEDAAGQTQNILKKTDDLLAQAGTSKSNLLTANIWVKDIGRDFQDMNKVWNEWLDPENKPVRATVEANMARPAILVEIQVTAALPEE
ncbi:Endoribonuclease L-PSP [Seminavis robusta]|uniref:Endoribonuclease L-PSP n=1 Tax=Seminavis robusta TaxID=568900 RepID=A0A9N8DGE6_9STRA|nr:Endoribonuclease L-PSP [Seminavis robusta]|eukprot:Sro75_g041170.1 Endoribonuclease L-PSP (165) ;mRNA; f:54770-55768